MDDELAQLAQIEGPVGEVMRQHLANPPLPGEMPADTAARGEAEGRLVVAQTNAATGAARAAMPDYTPRRRSSRVTAGDYSAGRLPGGDMATPAAPAAEATPDVSTPSLAPIDDPFARLTQPAAPIDGAFSQAFQSEAGRQQRQEQTQARRDNAANLRFYKSQGGLTEVTPTGETQPVYDELGALVYGPTKAQREAEAQGKRDAAATLRTQRAQGVAMQTTPTGQVQPVLDEAGNPTFKPAVLSPLTRLEDGRAYRVGRDATGNQHYFDLERDGVPGQDYHVDKTTKERYVTAPGPDGARQRQSIEPTAAAAPAPSVPAAPTPPVTAPVPDDAAGVDEEGQLVPAVAAAGAQAQAPATQIQTPEGDTPTIQPGHFADGLLAAHQAGTLESGRLKELLPKALEADKAAEEHAKLLAQDGVASKLKALGYGAGKGAAFLATAPIGAGIGAEIGGGVGAFFGGVGAVPGAAIGGTLGGLVSGTIGAFTADKLLRKLGDYNDTVKSFTDSADLHPYYSAAGELIGFGAGIPKAATKAVGAGVDALAGQVGENVAGRGLRAAAEGYKAGGGGVADTVRNLAEDASIRTAAGASAGTVAKAIGTRVGGAAAANVAIDTAIKEGSAALGLSDDHQTLGGAAQAAAIGAFTSGHGLRFEGYNNEQVGALGLRGKLRAEMKVGLNEPISPQDVATRYPDLDAASVQEMARPFTAKETEVFGAVDTAVRQAINEGRPIDQVTARQATTNGKPYGVTSAEVSGPGASGRPEAGSNPQTLPLLPGGSAPNAPTRDQVQPAVPALPLDGQSPRSPSPGSDALAPASPPSTEKTPIPSPGVIAPAPAGQAPGRSPQDEKGDEIRAGFETMRGGAVTEGMYRNLAEKVNAGAESEAASVPPSVAFQVLSRLKARGAEITPDLAREVAGEVESARALPAEQRQPALRQIIADRTPQNEGQNRDMSQFSPARGEMSALGGQNPAPALAELTQRRNDTVALLDAGKVAPEAAESTRALLGHLDGEIARLQPPEKGSPSSLAPAAPASGEEPGTQSPAPGEPVIPPSEPSPADRPTLPAATLPDRVLSGPSVSDPTEREPAPSATPVPEPGGAVADAAEPSVGKVVSAQPGTTAPVATADAPASAPPSARARSIQQAISRMEDRETAGETLTAGQQTSLATLRRLLARETSAAPASTPAISASGLVGQKINRLRTAFAPESGTLDIPRSEMPQVAAEHRGAMANFLKARGIDWQNEEVLPGSLKPTQGDFSPGRVERARGFEGTDRRILVSADGHVVDGHHQWLARLQDHPNEPMPVVRLNAPVRDILAQIHEFPSAGLEKAPEIEDGAAAPATPTGPAPLAVGDRAVLGKTNYSVAEVGDAKVAVTRDSDGKRFNLPRNTVERARVAPAGSPAEAPPAVTSAPVAKPARSFSMPTAPHGAPDVLDLIAEEGGMMSRTEAERRGKLAQNSDLWDDAPTLRGFYHHAVYGGQQLPDQMAQGLQMNHGLGDGTVGTLHRMIGEAVQTRRTAREEATRQATVEKQAARFGRDALSEGGKGAKEVNAGSLNVGDTLFVGGEKLKVTAIEPDTLDVTLEDHSKYGVQQVRDGQALFVERVKHAPEGQGEDFEQAPPAAAPAPDAEPFSLESPTGQQLDAEAETARQRGEVEAGQNKRLTAREIDTTGDFFGEPENPLFAAGSKPPGALLDPASLTPQERATVARVSHALKADDELREVASALGVRGVYPADLGGAAHSGIAIRGGRILVDPAGMADTLENLGSGESARTWLADALAEELVHAATAQVPDARARLQEIAEAPEHADLRGFVGEHYTGFERLSAEQQGMEMVRAVVQGRWKGKLTEGIFRFLRDLLARLRDFLTKAPENGVFKRTVVDVERVMREAGARFTETEGAPEPARPLSANGRASLKVYDQLTGFDAAGKPLTEGQRHTLATVRRKLAEEGHIFPAAKPAAVRAAQGAERLEEKTLPWYAPENETATTPKGPSGDSLGSALRDLRGGQPATGPFDGVAARKAEVARQSARLRAWAQAERRLIDPKILQRLRRGRGGNEHDVFLDAPSGRMVKVGSTAVGVDGYGSTPRALSDRKGDYVAVKAATPAEYLQRFALSNEVFGDDVRLHGFTQRDGQTVPVISQPFIKGREATPEEIADFMEDEGFRPVGLYDWFRDADGVSVMDAHEGNFLTDERGRTVPIDTIVTQPEGKLRELLGPPEEESDLLAAAAKPQPEGDEPEAQISVTRAGGKSTITRRTASGESSVVVPTEKEAETLKGMRGTRVIDLEEDLFGQEAADGGDNEPPDLAGRGTAAGQEQPTPVTLGSVRGLLGRARHFLKGDPVTRVNKHLAAAHFDSIPTRAAATGRQAGNAVRLDLPDVKDQEAMPYVVEAGGRKSELLDDLAKVKAGKDQTLSAEEIPKLEHAIANFPRLDAAKVGALKVSGKQREAEVKGGLPVREVNNYVTRLTQSPEHAAGLEVGGDFGTSDTGGSSGVVRSRYFTQGREFPKLADAVAAGFRPKTTNIADLIEHRVRSGQRLLNERAYWRELAELKAKDGQSILGPVVETSSDAHGTEQKVPRGYTAVPAGDRLLTVHRDYAPLLGALYGESALRQHAVGRGALKVAAIAKHGTVGILDTFHLCRLGINAATGFQEAGHKKGLAALNYAPEDLDRAVEAGKITREEAAYAKETNAIVEGGLKEGLNVGRVADNLVEAAHAAGWLESIPGVGPKMAALNDFIFSQFQRGAMAQSYVVAYQRNRARFPELSDPEVHRRSATEINEFFGNLGNQGFFQSKTMQDAARLVFLAPQWAESRFRNEARAFGQGARAAADAVQGKGFRVGNIAQAMAVSVLSALVANQLVNLFTRGKLTFQNEEEGHRLDGWIPGGPQNRGFFFSPLSLAAEYSHALKTYLEKGESLPDALTHIAGNKLSPGGRAVKDLATGRDFAGRPFGSMGERLKAAAVDAAPFPIPAGPFVEKNPKAPLGYGLNHQPGALKKQVFAAAGLKLENAPSAQAQVRDLARAFRPPVAGTLPPSAYAPLRRALDNGDEGEARAEVERLVAGGKPLEHIGLVLGIKKDGGVRPLVFTGSKQNEEAMLKSFSPKQRELYQRAQAEHETTARLFQKVAAGMKAPVQGAPADPRARALAAVALKRGNPGLAYSMARNGTVPLEDLKAKKEPAVSLGGF